jgi:hypothetical protein
MPLTALIDGGRVKALSLPDRDWVTTMCGPELAASTFAAWLVALACIHRHGCTRRPIGELRCFGHWPGEGDHVCRGESHVPTRCPERTGGGPEHHLGWARIESAPGAEPDWAPAKPPPRAKGGGSRRTR